MAIKIYQVNGATDWWAGEDAESVWAAYVAFADDLEEADEEHEKEQWFRPLDDAEMDSLKFTDDDGTTRTFRQQLEMELKSGDLKYPRLFASENY